MGAVISLTIKYLGQGSAKLPAPDGGKLNPMYRPAESLYGAWGKSKKRRTLVTSLLSSKIIKDHFVAFGGQYQVWDLGQPVPPVSFTVGLIMYALGKKRQFHSSIIIIIVLFLVIPNYAEVQFRQCSPASSQHTRPS